MSRPGKNLGKMAVLLDQIKIKGRFFRRPFFIWELKFWVSRGKFCKDWECFFPNLYEYPLDSQRFKKHACVRGAGEVLFPAPLPRGERRRRQKEFVI